MLELLRLLVEFTPTEKDDEVLAKVESFLQANPQLIGLVFQLLRAKL